MEYRIKKSAKLLSVRLTMALIITFLLSFQMPPLFAENAESIEVQKKVDEALGATELPEPATKHLHAPHTIPPPLTGQPYQQQPAAAQDDFSARGDP